MAALFPRWSNTAVRLALGALAVVAIGIPLFLWGWVRTPYITGQYDPREQPVQFDHRHHVRDDGIGCMYCHSNAWRSANAGVPPTGLCMGCHNQIWNNSPLLTPVRKAYFTGQPVRWNRVYRLPEFVYFNHAIHVNKGLGCESCHGRVDQMAQVYQVAPLTMGWCLDCHRDPEQHLRPEAEVATMGYVPRVAQAALGAELKRRYDVREYTNCTTCHR